MNRSSAPAIESGQRRSRIVDTGNFELDPVYTVERSRDYCVGTLRWLPPAGKRPTKYRFKLIMIGISP
jgi:hypothetical protein